MSSTRFDAKARPLAQQTGLDRLGQAKLEKLDKNGDGIVTLTDVRRLVKDAGLEKDGSLSRDDRKRIDAALGGAPASSTTATTGPSSVVASMTGGKKTLGDTYIDTLIKGTAKGISISIDGGLWSGGGHVGDKSRAMVIPGFDAAAIDVLFYGTKGQTGMPSSSGGPQGGFKGTSFAAGMAVAVADKARGVVLMDVAARDFLDGKQPSHKRLLSLTDIAKSPAVRSFAKKSGLDAKTLTVQLKEVWLSAAFQDPKLATLAFEAKLTDKNGKSKTETFSTYLSGDLSKSVDKLAVDALETGIVNSWGYLLPPSAKPEAETKKNVGGGGGGAGGGEHVSSTAVSAGGGEHSAPLHHHVPGGGGGEHGGFVPSYGGGGGE